MDKSIKTANTNNKNIFSPRATIIIALVFLFILLPLCIYLYLKIENIIVSVLLYIVATFITSGAIADIVIVSTHKSSYVSTASFAIWAGSLIKASTLTDVSALNILSLIFAGVFASIAIINATVQLSEDVRKNHAIAWYIAIILIFFIGFTTALKFERPIYIGFIPFALIALYHEYLRAKFLRVITEESQSRSGVSGKAIRIITSPIRSILSIRSIRKRLYFVLLLFSGLFYLMVTQESTATDNISLFYEIMVPAYLGILAIVVAFTVIVVRREPQKIMPVHLESVISSLAKMYVLFALATMAGLLLGSEVNSDILTQSIKLGKLMESVNGNVSIFRIFILEFAVLAFPTGLLYLHAMIEDFICANA